MRNMWTEHLSELRRRIMFILGLFMAALIAGFMFSPHFYQWLVLPGVHLVVLGPGDTVSVYLLLAGTAATIVTIPVGVWQLWVFIAPGLNPRERAIAVKLLVSVTVMFAAGVCFGYFFVFPNIYRVLIRFSIMGGMNPLITAREYFGFMVNIVIPFALIFEIPIATFYLTGAGIINPYLLSKFRRYAYLVCVVVATLISPPELVSHVSVLVPMLLIYEFSASLCAVAYRRKIRRGAQ